MKIAIISHTEHIIEPNGKIKGWGPTVREINFLATKFEAIYHIACVTESADTPSSLYYDAPNIHFLPIPSSGGKGIAEKLNVFSTAPQVIKQIKTIIDKVDAIQLRVPTGIANYLLPWFTINRKKPLIWVKYAGNWKQEHAPAGYRFQRWWLTKNYLNCKVTINGKWDDQPTHCFTFENPCLSETEKKDGLESLQRKNYSGNLTAAFIGRIEHEKGVGRILDALKVFAEKNIKIIHFIGDGPEKKYFEELAASQQDVNCIFHGNLSRTAIPVILEQSHLLLLPSTASEGFPKVIAEGANYGAVPVVSDISSIGQYVNNSNGYIWNRNESFQKWLSEQTFDADALRSKSVAAYDMADDFTFEKYYHKLMSLILNDRPAAE